MEKQAIDFNASVRGIVTYAASSETIERAQSARFESRKVVADFVRTMHDKQWKTISKPIKAAIDSLAVGIVADKVGLLGVIKTCCEYSIMPTTLNADRLRKAKTWTTLEGKVIPNGYGKVHTKPGAGQKAPAQLDASKTATTTPATTTPATTTSKTQTTPKVPSASPATAQKTEDKVHPLTSNVSSTDEPLSSREDFKVKMIHLFKNETFRDEYCTLLATMLDIEKATLTRCMFQACDAIKV